VFIADYGHHLATVKKLRQRFEADPTVFTDCSEIKLPKAGMLTRACQRLFR
jgi:hypothetical protein